jgi:hypothetical protein
MQHAQDILDLIDDFTTGFWYVGCDTARRTPYLRDTVCQQYPILCIICVRWLFSLKIMWLYV